MVPFIAYNQLANSPGSKSPTTLSENIFTPGPRPNSVRAADGTMLTPPADWVLLPPGDAALTRRVKAAGEHWVVQEKKGRKIFSRGVWAAVGTIDAIRAELQTERATDEYAKRKQSDARRRENVQAEYVEDFYAAVVKFLAFHPAYADFAARPDAQAVAGHMTLSRSQRAPSLSGRNGYRSSGSVPRRPSLPGCGTRRPATIRCPSR